MSNALGPIILYSLLFILILIVVIIKKLKMAKLDPEEREERAKIDLEERKEMEKIDPEERKEIVKRQSISIGIISCVLGGAAGIWVITRLTSLMGKIHSWEPPFTEYETTTIVGAVIAILLIIIGVINLTRKKS